MCDLVDGVWLYNAVVFNLVTFFVFIMCENILITLRIDCFWWF